MTTTQSVWMTPEALDELRREYSALTARGDDLTMAEQAQRLHLSALIQHAETEPRPHDGLVEPGMTVVVRIAGDDEPTRFLLGERELHSGADVVSPASPLGGAVNGQRVGATVSFTTHAGHTLEATIISTEPFAGAALA